MLLRFFVSTLWRASVSREPFFHRVDLGPHQQAAARLALDDADDHGVFDVVLARWPAPAEVGVTSHGMMDPFRHKYEGVNAYRMYFGAIVAEIKVDQQPFPGALAQLGLRAAPPVRVVVRDFTKSSELAVMRKTAQLALTPKRRSLPT
jgi:hypothetical protein